MSKINISFFSKSLSRTVQAIVLLPNDDEKSKLENPYYKYKTRSLYLLHGYLGEADDWLLGTNISELSVKYNLAVILPSGENSFYVNAAAGNNKYGEFIGQELVNFISSTFNLSTQKKDTFIGGLSMGGFGALVNGLTYYNTFGKIFGLSSALICNDIKDKGPNYSDGISDYNFYHAIFGNLNHLDTSKKNPELLIKQMLLNNVTIPPIYLACGKQDFLNAENREFDTFLNNKQIPHIYVESKGIHEWPYWRKQVIPAVQWLFND
ncbi:alpha/beta hydrolase-fold protein [Pediococcus ethanolidurans]|uniref:alpha/beta hydrolase n=2 Tax=Pediococcus ethanolidurans TaxID=319653 RepID=UPI0021E8A127|nr:alpha/beta hydrolase-fold protein [Pediococcus ethanolidurans]MCV3315579.1 alpha/beta hydrolase-fold protein [Pediococcus ethanolidurans]MCV3321778.1 alpha/beta hydrolase-fold protein [Pediococcus ethanolidurans]MCV3323756.1 alpha/beta hydrolase-fold protein [Pediococcus ethanolidurans]